MKKETKWEAMMKKEFKGENVEHMYAIGKEIPSCAPRAYIYELM